MDNLGVVYCLWTTL